jgi:predicted dienelactone hydrolase
VQFRSVAIPASRNCPIAGDKLPLIVISHGSGAWFGAHHDTAAMLADAGFVVVAINHPGDNASDARRSDDLSILIDRPADIRRLTGFMLGAWSEASKLDAQRIGMFGFSRGAYTGLVIVGGQLDLPSLISLCPEGFINGMCEQLRKGEVPAQRPGHDPRFKVAVLADVEFGRAFTAEGLQGVQAPVQLWGSARGGDGVLPEDGATIHRNLRAKPDYYVVPKTAHFAFAAPCSAAETQALPDICIDAGDFGRVAFHKDFNATVLAFFRKHLTGTGQ